MRVDAYENRLRLLTACRDLIAQEGTTAVTVKEIIGHAGLSSATFFRHFGSKDAVINEVSINRWSLLEFHARRPLDDEDDNQASLKQIIRILDLFTRMITSDDEFINATGLRIGQSPGAILPIRETFEPNFANLWVDAQRRGNIRSWAHPRDAIDMTASIRDKDRRLPMLTTLVSGLCTDVIDAEQLIYDLFSAGKNRLPLR